MLFSSNMELIISRLRDPSDPIMVAPNNLLDWFKSGHFLNLNTWSNNITVLDKNILYLLYYTSCFKTFTISYITGLCLKYTVLVILKLVHLKKSHECHFYVR